MSAPEHSAALVEARTHTLRAMGCDIVVGGASEVEVAAIGDLFAHRDAVFSRFRPASELTRVNGSRSSIVPVSGLFARTVKQALRVAAATDGLVDPTLGAAIEAAGYDRDFAALRPDPRPPGPAEPGTWRAVRVRARLLARPAGVRLDLNGVVKSLAVDEALSLLRGPGFVAAGGDIRTRGTALVALPDGEPIRVASGGIATSGTTRRRWQRGGREQHHLIDPRTGRPSRSRWSVVTVAAGSCVAADVAAKAAFLLDRDGPDWLDGHGLPGRFLGERGTVVNAAWRAACGEAAAAGKDPRCRR